MNAVTHPVALTADELAFKRTVRPTDDLQRATLAAALRTGKRYGVSVGAGRYSVQLVGYRLTKSGKPTGYGEITPVASDLTIPEAIAVLESVK